MTKLLLAAAAGLTLTACASRPEPHHHAMFVSGPGAHHYVHRDAHRYVVPRDGRQVTVIRRDGRGPLIINGRYVDRAPMARFSSPDPETMARLHRDTARIREDALRMAEAARRQGESARLQGEIARRHGEEARARGEQARARGEQARARGEEARRTAERLRAQCERGEIECTILDNGSVVIVR